jgi:hypothetical protein
MVQVTGARIAARVKRQFGDESGVQVVDNDIINWLNDAMTEAAVQNGSINLKRRFIPAIRGEYVLTLPDQTNLAAIQSLSYRSSGSSAYVPLTFASSNSFEELFPEWQKGSATGIPSFYTSDVNNRLRVYPAPAVTDGRGFSLMYNSFFTEYTDLTQEMSISPRYFQYLLEYCLMKAYEMDENWEAADRKASFIQSTLNSLSSDDSNVNQTKYPILSSTPEDM